MAVLDNRGGYKMKTIFTDLPKFCPQCGHEFDYDEYSKQDFYAGCSFHCNCGSTYQYISEDVVLDKLYDELDKYFINN